MPILDSSKLKEFADDNFKFDNNGKKLSKQVENTVGKGEIARYAQFLLFPQCFQRACFPGKSKGVIVWEWVNPLPDMPILDSSKLKEFADDNSKFDENGKKLSKQVENCGKRRNCSLRAISPFPTVFSKGLFPRGVKRCHCVGMG